MDFSSRLKTAASWMAVLLAMMWGLELINMVTGHRLSRIGGIHPRSLGGLLGIPLSPFLHFSFFHLLMNTVPFAILGGLICMQERKLFAEVSLLVLCVSGLAVWLLGRSAAHAGASGLIFGYFGFLLASGWYAKDIQSIVIAFLVLVYYGGMILGVLPLRAYISWESHLFGFLSGLLAARLNLET